MADLVYRLVIHCQKENLAEMIRVQEELSKLTNGELTPKAPIGLESIAHSILRMGFMVNMLESAYMRQEVALIMLANAQDRYNDAVARFGVNSEQARRAARLLAQEKDYLDKANMRASVSMILMMTSLFLYNSEIIKNTLTTIYATTSKIFHIIAQKTETISLWTTIKKYSLIPIIIGTVITAIMAFQQKIPSKEKGGTVEKSGVYLVHEGEIILPSTTTKVEIPPIHAKTLEEALRRKDLAVKQALHKIING